MNKLLELERQNLINWYPFKENSSVLVISEDRALYNYLIDNSYDVSYVECSCNTCGELKQEREYDYIIIDGVLSFAPSYCGSKNPFKSFINIVSENLKSKGVLLLSTANRLGLKYLCGAPEQNTGAIGAGLNEYEFVENIRTFSKRELKELIREAGFEYMKFYYPYPDYVYPKEIFTDDSIGMESFGSDYYELIRDRLLLYNESSIAKQFSRENIADVFANSFFVEISHVDLANAMRPTYVKINSDRNDAFKINTAFVYENNREYVVKSAISKAATNHIRKLHEIEEKNVSDKYNFLCGEYKGDSLKYEFLKGKTLDNVIEKYIDMQDRDKIVDCLDDMYNTLLDSQSSLTKYRNEKFIKVFGDCSLDSDSVKCVCPANIDLICDNIFIKDSVYTIIDAEWTFDFDIPVAFIMWRTINELYYKHTLLKNIISREELEEKFNINISDEAVFVEWNKFFTLEYVGANKLAHYSYDKYQVSLDNILDDQRRRHMLYSSLYVDYGHGYSEKNKLYAETKLCGNEFTVEYQIKDYQNLVQLRWDPVENILCNCFAQIYCNGKWVRIVPDNAENVNEEWDEFNTMDPRYFISEYSINNETLRIRGRIQYIDNKELSEHYSELEVKCSKSQDENMHLNKVIQKKELELDNTVNAKKLIKTYAQNLESDIDSLVNENDKQIIEIHRLKEELEKTRTLIHQVEAERDAEKTAKDTYVHKYNCVVATKGWRALEKIRRLKNKIKG